mgnify:CR=1 FL=1
MICLVDHCKDHILMKQVRFGFFLVCLGFSRFLRNFWYRFYRRRKCSNGSSFFGWRWMDEFTTYTHGSLSGRFFLHENQRGQPLWVDVWFTWSGHTIVHIHCKIELMILGSFDLFSIHSNTIEKWTGLGVFWCLWQGLVSHDAKH